MSRATLFRFLVTGLPGMLLFAWGALSHIDVPGISMDAVNPDYLAVTLLHPGVQLPEWTVPGSFLFDRIPLIGQIYHGALSLYLGLPAYALFGTGILGIRLANLTFGLAVLAATAAFLLAFRVRPVLGAATLGALALDPAFLFAFRTPFYVTLLTAAPVLASFALIESRQVNDGPGFIFGAGLLAGLAIYGYFIAVFTLPVLAIHLWLRYPSGSTRHPFLLWTAGLALGCSPYAFAALLLLKRHSLFDTLSIHLHILGPGRSPLPFQDRIFYFADLIRWTIQGVGPSGLMLQAAFPPVIPSVKFILLLVLPNTGLLLGPVRQGRNAGILIAAGLVAASFLLVVVFGDRLWLTHVIPLLPVLYAALALTLESVAQLGLRPVILALPLLPLLIVNALDRSALFAAIERTGGVGLYSDALDHFAEDSARQTAPTQAYFPDWGVFTGFAMLTSGRIPITLAFEPAEARRELCTGRDALLATIRGPSPGLLTDPRIQSWTTAIDWSPPTTQIYRQRDGTPVLEVRRWHAIAPAPASCTGVPLR